MEKFLHFLRKRNRVIGKLPKIRLYWTLDSKVPSCVTMVQAIHDWKSGQIWKSTRGWTNKIDFVFHFWSTDPQTFFSKNIQTIFRQNFWNTESMHSVFAKNLQKFCKKELSIWAHTHTHTQQQNLLTWIVQIWHTKSSNYVNYKLSKKTRNYC